MALDMSTDYLIWDNPEAVTVEVRKLNRQFGTSAGDTFAASTAKRRALTWKELTASGGAYTGQDLVWLIPQAVLDEDRVIKAGDVVIDEEGVRYTVLDPLLGKWGQTWRLVTRDLVLAHDLSDTIDIQRAALGYDDAGASMRRYPPYGGETPYANLKARVQIQEQRETDERGLRGLKETYQIIVEKDIDVREVDRVKWTTIKRGTLYLEIKGYTQPDRIDVLPILDCEVSL